MTNPIDGKEPRTFLDADAGSGAGDAPQPSDNPMNRFDGQKEEAMQMHDGKLSAIYIAVAEDQRGKNLIAAYRQAMEAETVAGDEAMAAEDIELSAAQTEAWQALERFAMVWATTLGYENQEDRNAIQLVLREYFDKKLAEPQTEE